MIPYEVIITSASRPHLLNPTLTTLLDAVDQPPQRILVHDDAAFPLTADERWAEVKRVLQLGEKPCPVLLTHADPPRRMGLALQWLLANVRTQYVLYSQDDFVTVRPLPIAEALDVMDCHHLHQIRFNKRATLGQKDTWQGVWRKQEVRFSMSKVVSQERSKDFLPPSVLTVADHWYFQTGLWRVSVLRAALAWLTATPERTAIFAACPAEVAINKVMDGDFGVIPGLSIPYRDDAQEPSVRAQVQRTFIWGPVGEDRYIRHIGMDPADWAGEHPRGDGEREVWAEKHQQAWAEIAGYPKVPHGH